MLADFYAGPLPGYEATTSSLLPAPACRLHALARKCAAKILFFALLRCRRRLRGVPRRTRGTNGWTVSSLNPMRAWKRALVTSTRELETIPAGAVAPPPSRDEVEAQREAHRQQSAKVTSLAYACKVERGPHSVAHASQRPTSSRLRATILQCPICKGSGIDAARLLADNCTSSKSLTSRSASPRPGPSISIAWLIFGTCVMTISHVLHSSQP